MARLAPQLRRLGALVAACLCSSNALAEPTPPPTDVPVVGFAGDVVGATALQWSESGQWIAARTESHALLIDPITLEERLRLDAPYRAALAFAPDGNLVAHVAVGETRTDRDAELWLFDLRSGKRVANLRGHDTVVTALAFNADGRWLAAGDRDGRTIVWSVAKRRPIVRLPPHTTAVDDIAFSKDGKQLTTRAGYTIWRWSLPDAKFLGNTYLHFESEERRPWVASNLATGVAAWPLADQKVQISRVEAGNLTELRQISSELSESPASFSPNGQQLMTTSSRALELWDVATGSHVMAQLDLASATLKPDGSEIATLGKRGLSLSRVETLKSGGHPMGICGGDVSPDGKTVASGGNEGVLLLWNAATGELRGRVKTADEGPCGLQFSPDGSALMSRLQSGIRTHDPLTGREIRRIEGKIRFWSARFSGPNPKEVIALREVGKDLEVVVIDVGSGAVKPLSGPRGKFEAAALSPDGRTLLTTESPNVSLWNVGTGKRIRTFRATGRLDELTFASNSTLVGVAAGKVVRFEVDTGRELDSFRPPAIADGDEWLRLGLGGTTVAYRANGKLRVWDLAAQRDRGTVEGPECFGGVASDKKTVLAVCEGGLRVNGLDKPASATVVLGPKWRFAPQARFAAVSSAAFSPDGRALAIAGADDTLRVWNLDSGKLELQNGNVDPSEHIAWSPDNKQFAVGLNWYQAALRDPVSGRLLKTFDAEPSTQDSGRILRLSWGDQALDAPIAFAGNGKELIFAANKRTVRWDLASGRVISTRPEQPHAISSDGEWLAFVSAPPENPGRPRARAAKPDPQRLRLVAVRTGPTRNFPLPLEEYSAYSKAAFNRDGSLIAVWSDSAIAVVETKTGRTRATLKPQWGQTFSVAFSPDGTQLAAVASGQALLFDIASGALIGQLEPRRLDSRSGSDSDGFKGGAFHASGKFIALAGDRGVTLWSPGTDKPVIELRLFENQDAGLLQSGGTQVELLGKEAAAARKLLRCRRGIRTLPFDSCAKTLEARGLLQSLVKP